MSLYRGAGGASDATDDSTVNAVAGYASSAASSASAAAASATTATNNATAAATSASQAASSTSSAATSASNAATSASNAASSASSASSSASSASTSATNASNSAGNASTYASEALGYRNTASTHATNAASSASAAAGSATSAANSAASALAIYGNTAAMEAAVDDAQEAALTAQQESQAASDSAIAAAESEDLAFEYSQNAAESATTAQSAANSAIAASTSANAAWDQFDDRYLGAKAADPTVDNDGNLLVAGALYFNTSTSSLKVYTGSVWTDAYTTGNGFLVANNNLSDLQSAATARTNLGLGTAALENSTDLVHTAGNETIAGTKTFSSNPVLSAGTVNGVAYLNGSKVLTTGSALTFDGTNFGVTGVLDVDAADNAVGVRLRQNATIGAGTEYTVKVAENVGVTFDSTDGGTVARSFIWTQVGSEAMRLTSTGLGVGTSSPSGKLTVAPNYALAMRTASGGYMGGLRYDTYSNEALILAAANNSPIYFAVNHDVTANQGSSNQLPASPGMVLTSTGLGIGTSSPLTNLQIQATNQIVDSYGNIYVRTSNNQAINLGGQLCLGGAVTDTGTGNGVFGAIAGRKENSTASNYAGYLQFSTSASGGSTAERMRLDSSGNLGIGTSSPSYKLDVTGPGTAGGTTLRLNDSASSANSKHLLLQRGSSTASFGIAGGLANDPLWISRSGGYDILLDSSGNLGLGVTPSAVGAYRVFEMNGTTGGLMYMQAGGTRTGQWYSTASEGGIGQMANAPFLFYTNNTERMRLDASGNWLLGQTSSIYSAVGRAAAEINGSLTAIYAMNIGGTNAGYIYHDGTNMSLLNYRSGALAFATNNTERARIDSSGRLGIGTSSPAFPLDLQCESDYGRMTANLNGTPFFIWSRSRGTKASPTAVQNGDQWGHIFTAYDGTSYVAGARIFAAVDGIPGTNDMPTRLEFHTSADGSVSPVERARIDSSGNLLVGTTTLQNNGLVTGKQATNTSSVFSAWNATTSGDAQFIWFGTEAGGTTRGSITYNRTGGLTAYNTTSDYRAKTVNGPVQNALIKVASLKPSTGRMNDAEQDIDFFVAHELQEVVPSAVTGEKDAVNEDGTPKYQMVDKSALIPLLTKAIQEQQAIIETLTARVAALESK